MTTPFMLPDIDPVALKIGFVAIRWYALAYIAGIVAGWVLVHRLLMNMSIWHDNAPPLSPDSLDDLIVWITLGIIFGGRLGYVLAYQPAILWQDPLQLFMVWQGGMSFHGGLLGVILAVSIFAKRRKIATKDLLNIGDLLATAAPIGLFFGRMANFINGELWGRATDAPWGVVFCNSFVCDAGLSPRHPSQLYEAMLEGIVLLSVCLWLIFRSKALMKPGLVMGSFLLGYGIFRSFIEQFREPDSFMPDVLRGSITMGMILSLPMILAGGWLIYRALKPVVKSPLDTEDTPTS